MSTSLGIIPSSFIHDHLPAPAASASIKTITHKHLFLRQLFSDTSGLQYVLLSHFFQSTSELGEQTVIYLCMYEEELEEWTAACKCSSFLIDWEDRIAYDRFLFSLRFRDQTELEIHVLTRLSVDQQDIFSCEDLLTQSSINRHGIKVSSISLMYTYWFAHYCMNGQSFPDSYRTFFLSLNLDERFQVLEVMEATLGFQISNLHQAFRSPSSYKDLIDYTLSSRNDMRSKSWRRGSWAYLSHLPHTFFQKVKS